jgi:hypothetical protein
MPGDDDAGGIYCDGAEVLILSAQKLLAKLALLLFHGVQGHPSAEKTASTRTTAPTPGAFPQTRQPFGLAAPSKARPSKLKYPQQSIPAATSQPEVCPRIISGVVNIAQIRKSHNFYKG